MQGPIIVLVRYHTPVHIHSQTSPQSGHSLYRWHTHLKNHSQLHWHRSASAQVIYSIFIYQTAVKYHMTSKASNMIQLCNQISENHKVFYASTQLGIILLYSSMSLMMSRTKLPLFRVNVNLLHLHNLSHTRVCPSLKCKLKFTSCTTGMATERVTYALL